MKVKRLLTLTLAMLFVLAFAGCNRPNTPDGGGDEDVEVRKSLNSVTLNILLAAEEQPADAVNVQRAINNALAKDGKPYTVNLEYTSFNGYSVTVEDKAKAGYDAAWSHVDNIGDMLAKNVIKKNLMPYLNVWGKAILEDVPEYAFKQYTDYTNGALYAIPRHAPMADDRSRIQLRKDWMDEVGVTEVKSIAQFDDYLAKISQADGIGMENGKKREGFYAHPADQANVHLLREICPSYYFPVYSYGTRPLYIDIDPAGGKYEVKSFYQSAAFVEWVEKCYEYRTLGYSPTNSISGSIDGQFNNGLLGTLGQFSVVKQAERIDKFKVANPTGELYDAFFESASNKKTVMRGGDNCMVALSYSKNTEEVVDFFNWTKDQENHDLLTLGVEGVNYYLTDNGRVTFTKNGQTIPANKRFSIFAPYWAYNDLDYMRFSDSLSDEWVAETKDWEKDNASGNPENYIVSPLVGFNIVQTTAYKTAYNRVAGVSTVVDQLATGRENPNRDTGNGVSVRQKLVADITANGIQDLIAEVQRQLDAFLAAQK